MRTFKVLAFFLLIGLSVKAQDKKTAPLSEVLDILSNTLATIDLDSNKVDLKSIEANFTVTNTLSNGIALNVWIFKLGRKTEKSNVRKITVNLSQQNGNAVAATKKASSDLKDFINAAVMDFVKLNQKGIFDSLSERQLTLEIGLVITKSINAGGESPSIGIFTLGAEGSKTKEQGHTLTLVFAKKKK
jgi:hypothetical protein